MRNVAAALRSIGRAPGFSLAVILSIFLGIGINTAIFSLAYSLILKGLDVPNSNRLVRYTFVSDKGDDFGLSATAFKAIKQLNRASSVFAWSNHPLTEREADADVPIHGALASGDTFTILQLHPTVGRLFSNSDDVQGGGPGGFVADLTYDYWRSHFQAVPSVVGRTLYLSGIPVTIAGVLPKGFNGLTPEYPVDVLLPLRFDDALQGTHSRLDSPNSMWLTVMGRLLPGQSLDSAKTNFKSIDALVRQTSDPGGKVLNGFFKPFHFGVESGRTGQSWIRNQYKEPILVLAGLAGLMLILCSANVALLLLARTAARMNDLAIRGALGASRWHLFGHTVLEAALLGLMGMVLGVLAGSMLARSLADLTSATATTKPIDTSLNFGTVIFAVGITLTSVLAASVWPAMRASRMSVLDELRSTGSTRRSDRTNWILSIQTAVSIGLVIPAVLLGSTFLSILRQHSGFDPTGVGLGYVDISAAHLDPLHAEAAARSILSRLDGASGIRSVTTLSSPPLSGWLVSTAYASRDGNGATHVDPKLWVEHVTSGYFPTMGTHLFKGRDFTKQDLGDTRICILSRSAANELFPNQDAIGKFVYESDGTENLDVSKALASGDGKRIIGIVEDAHFSSLRLPPERAIYTLTGPGSFASGFYVAAKSEDAALAVGEIRRAISTVVPVAVTTETESLSSVINRSIRQDHMLVRVAGAFALIALLLMGIGIFGVLDRAVAIRRREIGIRMALGATKRQIAAVVTKQIIAYVFLGIVAGLAFSYAGTSLIKSLLYGVSSHNMALYAVSIGFVSLVSIVAVLVPLKRAFAVDPALSVRVD